MTENDLERQREGNMGKVILVHITKQQQEVHSEMKTCET